MKDKNISKEEQLKNKIVLKEQEITSESILENLCVSCGDEKENKELQLCDSCEALSNREFYEIKTLNHAKRHYRKVMHKIPEKEEKSNLKDTFKEAEKKNMIMGIMPSQCPYCNLMSKNSECITGFIRDSDEYKRFVIGKEVPKLVCKRCGDLSLYLKWQYDFEHTESVQVLELIKNLIVDIKKRKENKINKKEDSN